MFANLNLQLTTFLKSGDTGLSGAEDGAMTETGGADEILTFSEFFNLSSGEAESLAAAAPGLTSPTGENLPADGKPLPPAIGLPETTAQDLLTGVTDESQVEPTRPAAAEADAELTAVQLDLTLKYTSNEIPASVPTEVSTDIPQDALALPPGLMLTPTGPVGVVRVPPEDSGTGSQNTSSNKGPGLITMVPPGPPLATPDAQFETSEDLLESPGLQTTVAVLPRDRRARLSAQAPLFAAAAGSEAGITRGQRPEVLMTEFAPLTAAAEPLRRPESMFVSPSASAQPATSSLAAMPNISAGDPNSPRTDLQLGAISTPVKEAGWGEKLAERVVLLAGAQTRMAEIRLTPAELGPLRVQISVDDGQAHVAFQANNSLTREAIEQALPRLREMLAESGLSLGQADVGEQNVAGGDRESAADSTSEVQGDTPDEIVSGKEGERQESVIGKGLVDTFA
ncbi:MAG: flagellar hook-length control protein FliK [Gammaproteobacteria bacterium]|nr:flagellar hook-length control protein FliK [Gammaproteobacteria bacterium]